MRIGVYGDADAISKIADFIWSSTPLSWCLLGRGREFKALSRTNVLSRHSGDRRPGSENSGALCFLCLALGVLLRLIDSTLEVGHES